MYVVKAVKNLHLYLKLITKLEIINVLDVFTYFSHPISVATSFHSFVAMSLFWYSLSFVSHKGFFSETNDINFSKSTTLCGEHNTLTAKCITEPTALTSTAGKNKLV